MKLTSEPKPVRIRIVSGGEEHSSIDSLRRNFCLPDLQKIEKQLIQWLNRQGNEGIEIAQELEKMPKSLANCTSLEEYFEIYKIFFKQTLLSHFNLKKRDFETLRDLHAWFVKNKNFKKNGKYLHDILWGLDEEYSLSIIEKLGKFGDGELKMLENFTSGHADYLLGKYYIEEVPYFIKGYKLLLSARKKGYTKKVHYYLEENKYRGRYFKHMFEQWGNIDIDFMEIYIAKCLQGKFTLTSDSIINIPLDSHVWTDEEKELAKFVIGCSLLLRNMSSIGRYNKALDFFSERQENDDFFIEEPFYYQKLFIISLLGSKLTDSEIKDSSDEFMEGLSHNYYPAYYLLTPYETNPLLDKLSFRKASVIEQIEIFLLNLFEF